MQRKTLTFAIVITLTSILAFGTVVSNAFADKVLIGFTTQPGPSEEALVRGLGGKIKYTYRIVPAISADVPGLAIARLRANRMVTHVHPDLKVRARDTELDNSWGVKHIDAGVVHSYNKGTGVKIAVVDSGIDYSHSDLDANYAGGYDFVNSDSDPVDDNGHGTHVAGTVAAEDNDVGVVGVAPEASLYALKVLDEGGSGLWSDVIAAIEWATDPNGDGDSSDHLDVTNLSLGSDSDPGSTVKSAFDNAYQIGVLHVASAGNSGNPPGKGDNVGYPARYDSVIAVAATDKNDKRARWSSTGPDVELSAPGVDINSTLLGDSYGEKSGTSMASPHVAGTAALVMIAYPSWTNADVRTQLQNTADYLGDPNLYGYGLVDADEAAPQTDVHDVAVTAIAAPSSVVEGDTATIDVTVENQGTYDETFDVVLTDDTDGVTIGTQSVSLAAGASTTVSFSWDTTGATLREHTLTATAGPVTDETDTADNSKSTVVTVESATTDIAITAVNAPSSVVQGDLVSVDVTVENIGNQDVTSDIDVTLADDTDVVTIGTQTISGGLAAGASTTLAYEWDTTDASFDDHTLTASHDFADDDTTNDSKSTTVTVNEQSTGNENDIYVSDTAFSEKHYGKGGSKTDLMTTVTIWRDADADGTSNSSGDEPVSNAHVSMTLTHDTDGDGTFEPGTDDDSWNFGGDTDSEGKVTFTLKFASNGNYKAEVTDVTHDTYVYNASLDADNPDYHTVGSTSSATALLNNYPEPFNPDTWIPFKQADQAHVVIKIYNVTGKLIRKLDLGLKPSGVYTSRSKAAYWDGRNRYGERVSSGIYFYKMEAGRFSAIKKMVIMK